MSSTERTETALLNALAQLTDLVRAWRDENKRTTTAGITSALIAGGSLDLNALQLSSREEFWRAAEAAKVIKRERLPNGHWYILLPDESLPDDVLEPRPKAHVDPETQGTTVAPLNAARDLSARLRNDVWHAFVDWEGAYRRYWDRTHQRAFFIPVAWAPNEPEAKRFVQIEQATFDTQTGWMRDFADDQADQDRSALLAALADGAPRGAFRRELDARGLVKNWRDRHRQHITDAVRAWASRHGVDIASVSDNRAGGSATADAAAHLTKTPHHPPAPPRPAGAEASTESKPSAGQFEGPPTGPGHLADPAAAAAEDASSAGGAPTDLATLRVVMHRVIDTMSLDELAALPIRASHLLQR